MTKWCSSSLSSCRILSEVQQKHIILREKASLQISGNIWSSFRVKLFWLLRLFLRPATPSPGLWLFRAFICLGKGFTKDRGHQCNISTSTRWWIITFWYSAVTIFPCKLKPCHWRSFLYLAFVSVTCSTSCRALWNLFYFFPNSVLFFSKFCFFRFNFHEFRFYT